MVKGCAKKLIYFWGRRYQYVDWSISNQFLSPDKIVLTHYRYHYVLKTHWLDGKWNCQIDHIIHMLVKYIVPHYQSYYARQNVRLEGPDLAGQWWQELLAGARDIFIDLILQFDLTQFHITSQSCLGIYYAIDLHRATCDCVNFLKAQFCKHIAAIYIHFPHLALDKIGLRPMTLSSDMTQILDQLHTSRLEKSLHLLIQDIAVLSQMLISEQPWDQSSDGLSLAVMDTICLAKYSLSVAIALTEGTSALSEKEWIAPDQRFWPETAKCIGVKWVPKWK